MNRIFRSVTVGVALAVAVLWCVPRDAFSQVIATPGSLKHGKVQTSISCVTGGTATWGSGATVALGGATLGRLSSECLKSGTVSVPEGVPFQVYVGCDKGLAADGDSCVVIVETKDANAPNAPTANRSWSFLGSGCSDGDSTDYPMIFNFNPDMDSVGRPCSYLTGSLNGGGTYWYRGTSQGQVRVSINGPYGDSTADDVGRWPIIISW